RARGAGATLSEYLISIGIGSLLAIVLVSVTMYSNRSFASLTNDLDLSTRGMLALDQMSRDIRQCVSLTTYASNQLVFSDGTNAASMILTYNPTARTLMRQQRGRTTTLLTECDSMQFLIYQRTPLPGTYDQYPAATATNCKVVAVKWTCSRTLLGLKAN